MPCPNRWLQRVGPLEARLCSDPVLCKLITRSQYLVRIGVEVELRWIPRRPSVGGHKRAEATARNTATSYVLGLAKGVHLDEGLD